MIEQLQKIEPQRDQLGYWIHPAFNHFYEQIAQGADGLTKTQMEQLENLIDHKISITEIWNQISDEDATRLEKGDMDVVSEWQPKPPNDKAFLVSIHDTDDGTVAWWATPQTINNKCVGIEKARQEMKRKAFEGYFKNTEIYNRECHLRRADILETWSKHLGCYSNIIAHESLLMWQAAQEQVLREQAEEAAQPNAFLSAVADMAMKLSSGDYALVPKEMHWAKADDWASAEWNKNKKLFLSENRDMTAIQVEEFRLRWCRNKAHQFMDQYKTIIASANK